MALFNSYHNTPAEHIVERIAVDIQVHTLAWVVEVP